MPTSPFGIAFSGLSLIACFALIWIFVTDDPLGGEPRVVAAIEEPPVKTGSPNPSPAPAPRTTETPRADGKTVTIIDGRSGARREVLVAASDAEPETVGTVAPTMPVAFDPRLIESSRYGPIPRVGRDGKRPLDVYARVGPGDVAGPRIAIVVGGLAVNATTDAVAKLPAEATLAFSPYGNDVSRNAKRARAKGHEILLHLPMDASEADGKAGSHTLLSGLSAEQNLDRLHWLLSRLHGYVGIVSYPSGRFAMNDGSVAPVLRDLATRGLLYLDDGGAAQGMGAAMANSLNLPFLRADLVIDSAAAELDAALARLESVANQRGRAVGIVAASPATIDRLVRWAKTLETRGIRLVPLSTMLAGSKQG